MLCVLCLIVLWGFSLVTSYSGVIDMILIIYYIDTLVRVSSVRASPVGACRLAPQARFLEHSTAFTYVGSYR